MKTITSCEYDMNENAVVTTYDDGTTYVISCEKIEDRYGETPFLRAVMDKLIYENPQEYTMLVQTGKMEAYLDLKWRERASLNKAVTKQLEARFGKTVAEEIEREII